MAKKDDTPRVPSKLAGKTTIRGAERKMFPGIYANPLDILAESQVAPESPNLLRLFGVTRQDLADIAAREGNAPGTFPGETKGGRGSAAAKRVMGPANTQRLIDLLGEARDTPLGVGMRGWYVMDPMYQRLAEIADSEEQYRQLSRDLNAYSAMASPGSDVLTEINRGSAANVLAQQGRLDEFLRYGGEMGRSKDPVMQYVRGHPYHSTAHGKPMLAYSRAGELTSPEPKVQLYEQASRNPDLGFQTDTLVGDAHWSRGVGLADTRTNASPGASYTASEAKTLRPWWQRIASDVDLQPVPAQATLWGMLARQTGVDTPVGAPKLELVADQIAKTAARERVAPEQIRDEYLRGKRQIGSARPGLLGLIAGGTGIGALLASEKGREALTTALDVLETPARGLMGAGRIPVELARGEDLDAALQTAAEVARQPLEQTGYDLGGVVTDYTGSPALGTAAYVGSQMLDPLGYLLGVGLATRGSRAVRAADATRMAASESTR